MTGCSLARDELIMSLQKVCIYFIFDNINTCKQSIMQIHIQDLTFIAIASNYLMAGIHYPNQLLICIFSKN